MLIQSFSTYHWIHIIFRKIQWKVNFFFFHSFLIWLSVCFCLFIPFCYLSFILIFQVFVTFYAWFCWLSVLLQSVFYFLSFLVSFICICNICSKPSRKILLSKRLFYDSGKIIFFKEQEASGFLSTLGIKTPLVLIPIARSSLF